MDATRVSSSFPPRWEKLDPIKCGIPTRSISAGGQGTVNRASSPNQGGGGGTELRDESAAIDGRSGKTHTTERVESAL